MRVILLCAGYGTRLYPLTKNRPKPLLPVRGRAILEWILEGLKEIRRIRRVYVVTNHRFAGHFQTWVRSVRYPWKIKIVDDRTTSNENRLGAVGDLHYLLQAERIGKEDLLVIAGDNLFDFGLRAFVRSAKQKRPHVAIAVFDVGDFALAKHYGLVKCTKEGRVIQFYEKPSRPSTTLASCGIYWMPRGSRVLLDKYLARGHNPDQPGHYMRWLCRNDKLYALPLEGHWWDIGNPQSYHKANKHFRRTPKRS